MKSETKKFFSSWSGGKDSSLAFLKAKHLGYKPKALFTALDSDGISTRAHGFEKDIIEKQAQSMGVKSYTFKAGWGEYEDKLLYFMDDIRKKGIKYGVFGDIDLISHRVWIENVCKKADIKPIFPLWNMEREQVVLKFLELGFKAKIVACKKDKNLASILGKELNIELIEELKKKNIDIAGENGEFHTIVYSGPIFKENLKLIKSRKIENEKNIIMKYKIAE